MIRTTYLNFLHIPKAGGTWVVRTLEAAGLETERVGAYHGTETDETWTYTQVRCPLQWLASMYCYMAANPSWPGPPEFGGRLRWYALDFGAWLRKWWDNGLSVADVYGAYTGNANRVGRLESGYADLCDALRTVGFEGNVPELEPINVKHSITSVSWSSELVIEIKKQEATAFAMYGYACSRCNAKPMSERMKHGSGIDA